MRARSRPFRTIGFVTLALGAALCLAASATTSTAYEAASAGLLLIGAPMVVLGGLFLVLNWVASYSARKEGSWDHHKPSAVSPRLAQQAPASEPAAAGRNRRRSNRLQLAGSRDGATAELPELAEPPDSALPPVVHKLPSMTVAVPLAASQRSAATPGDVQTGRAPDPRELAWPHPPRQGAHVATEADEDFIDKLVDDALARAEPPVQTKAPPRLLPATVPHEIALGEAQPAQAHPSATPWVWTPQMLRGTDPRRFASLVEQFYQQAGFSTELEAGLTAPGAVVLWLFSRHQPGSPASVVSCVHCPGSALALEAIDRVAELVSQRELPRGQLVTTAELTPAIMQKATERCVHLMHTARLLALIQRRSPAQQRALANCLN